MKYFSKPIVTLSASLMLSTVAATAQTPESPEAEAPLIEKPAFTPGPDGHYTIDALEALGSVKAPALSPDGKTLLFGIGYESVEQNRSNVDLYTCALDGTGLNRITRTPRSESGAVWIEGGRRIAFSYEDKDGKQQLWSLAADGSDRRQLTAVEGGIAGFLFSPSEKKVLLIGSVKYSREAKDVYPDLPKATGRLIDDLMYKHWDEWVTENPHPFIGDYTGQEVINLKDIMADEPQFEAPMKPFGGIESFAWAPDDSELIYVSRKKTGMEYAVSTNSDLYVYTLADGKTRNLTEGMQGYDTCPAYSPDGKYVAWLSMEHDGYESDKNRIFILDRVSGEKTDLTTDWDYTADAIAWAPDSKEIYFIAPKDGVTPVFSVRLKDKAVRTLAEGVCDFATLLPAGKNKLVTMRHSMLAPNEICVIDLKAKDASKAVTQITDVNTELLSQLKMPTVEKRIVRTTSDEEMTVWVLYPAGFDPAKKYPAILYCQGGPQQAVSQFWSTRWNLALMAAQGYIVIAPNRHGLPGFGTKWNEQISGDYGGQNMQDYLSAVDDMKKESYIDAEHIGAVGASYGGFSVYWLAGNHDKRFACFIAHAGIFNTESQYLETEEMWFANWDLGGPFWAKDNATAQRTYANSPHRFVDRWDTPILVTHGEYDFRILASQGMMAFNAARLRGVPAEMLIFPDENHWILKPQNAVMWQRVFFRWLDRWLKDEK
ncbi:MAG: S9 family peptidase [Candidatus Amulumruptor caecigallinarius]|nr:S9 family peptidase [Candidatus Amulumruptor caecigallinarius]MCM1396254.1 S9 family peptidase [Candidatus Amulumruptor caecigallinarius]MCM1454306.1 S9 family peptidase [bacterium]